MPCCKLGLYWLKASDFIGDQTSVETSVVETIIGEKGKINEGFGEDGTGDGRVSTGSRYIQSYHLIHS